MENKEVTFKKNTGRETTVKIISEVPINSGAHGNIFNTIVEINGHRKRFIVKMYGSKFSPKITNAVKNYSLAKRAGLKVFPTFRISKDGQSILMTTGFSENKICVGSNNIVTVNNLERPLIKKFENVDEFLSKIFQEGLKAAQRGIGIFKDVLFFILSKNDPTKIDFVLGDLDNLSEIYPTNPTKYTGIENMGNIREMLVEFCRKNVDPVIAGNFVSQIEYYYNQAVKNVNESELS